MTGDTLGASTFPVLPHFQICWGHDRCIYGIDITPYFNKKKLALGIFLKATQSNNISVFD
jgi:hypothetical protein